MNKVTEYLVGEIRDARANLYEDSSKKSEIVSMLQGKIDAVYHLYPAEALEAIAFLMPVGESVPDVGETAKALVDRYLKKFEKEMVEK